MSARVAFRYVPSISRSLAQPLLSASPRWTRSMASTSTGQPTGGSTAAQSSRSLPSPPDFKPKDNPAFILHGKLSTSYETLPVPEVGPDEALVEVKKTGICGSDVHFYNSGRLGHVHVCSPMCLGHESAGIIVQLGSNLAAQAEKVKEAAKEQGGDRGTGTAAVGKRAFMLGDRVALEPGVTCRMCDDCRGGRYNICEHMAFAAYPPFDGTLQRYYKLPTDVLYHLPDSVALEYGAMMEPLSVSVHSLANVGKVKAGNTVLIFGAGPVGLLAMAVAKGLGAAKIIAVDINEERLNFAKDYAATHTWIPGKPKDGESRPDYSVRSAQELLLATGTPIRGPGAIDVGMDATGAETCIQTGINAIRPGGTFVQTGHGNPDAQVPISRIITEELSLRGSWRYSHGDYPMAIDLVARGLIDLKPLLTHTFKFKDALEAFEMTKNGKDKDGNFVIKCVIDGPE